MVSQLEKRVLEYLLRLLPNRTLFFIGFKAPAFPLGELSSFATVLIFMQFRIPYLPFLYYLRNETKGMVPTI